VDSDDAFNSQEAEFSIIVNWLTEGPNPIKQLWLPITRAASLCLDRLSDPQKAIKILLKRSKDLYSAALELMTGWVDVSSSLKIQYKEPVVEQMDRFLNETDHQIGHSLPPDASLDINMDIEERTKLSTIDLTALLDTKVTYDVGLKEILFQVSLLISFFSCNAFLHNYYND
jgi:hypothetical protein